MRHRPWLRAVLPLLMLSLAAPVLAWDGVTPAPGFVNASGLGLGPKLGAEALGGRAMWVDSAGLVIALAQTNLGLSSELPHCWKLTDKGATDLGVITGPDLDPTDGGSGWRIAARAGLDSFVLIRSYAGDNRSKLTAMTFFQGSCTTPFTKIAHLVAPPGYPGGSSIAAESLPLTAEGNVYFALGDIIRIDTKAAVPEWQVAVTLEALRTQLGLPVGAQLEFRGMALTGDDRLWIAFETSDGKISPKAGGLVQLGKDGKLTVLHPADPNLTGLTQLMHSGQFGAMLIAMPKIALPPLNQYRALAILDEAKPFAFSGRAPPWPLADQLGDGSLVGGSDGGVYVRSELPPTQVQRGWLSGGSLMALAAVPEFADFDRDSVSAKREAELGTSDLQYDSDGDGFNDGAELGLLGTDPKDPASHPAVAKTADLEYGPSLLINDSSLLAFPGKDTSFFEVSTDDGPLLCGVPDDAKLCKPPGKAALVAEYPCTDAAAKVSCLQMPGLASAFSPEGPYSYVAVIEPKADGGGELLGMDRLDVRTGKQEPFFRFEPGVVKEIVPEGTHLDSTLYPLPDKSLLLTAGFRDIYRLSAKGMQLLVRSGQYGCPTGSGASDMTPCLPETAYGYAGMQVVGYHRGLHGWVFRFTRFFSPDNKDVTYLAVTESKVGFLADGFEIADGLEIAEMHDIPGGGLLVKAEKHIDGGAGQSRNGTFVLPDLFGPGVSGKKAQAHISGGPGAWFFRGFFGKQYQTYKVRVKPAACSPKSPCEFSFASAVKDIIEAFRVEWVPYGKALEKGEVVVAASRRFLRGGFVEFSQPDGSYGFWTAPFLSRVTRLGAVVEWLDVAQFAALAKDPAAQATLKETPLGKVGALAVAPDGNRLCVVESESRVWELALKDGLPTGVTLVDQGAGLVGCAYDESGALARLVAAPAMVRIGNQTIAGATNAAADGLIRVAGQWLIRGKPGVNGSTVTAPNAYCLDATGKITQTSLQMAAFAEVPGGMAYIDTAGSSWLGRDPCDPKGVFPQEELGVGTWNWVIEGYISLAGTRALALRPDGMFVVSRDTGDQYQEKHLFRMYPTYRALGGQAFPEHDAWRRTAVRTGLLSIWAVDIGAMVTIPGGDPKADWGHFQPEPVAKAVEPVDVKPKPVVKPEPKPAADSGCSAHAGSAGAGAWLVALMAAVVWLRRRRGLPG